MFDAMTAYAGFDELEPGTGTPRFDAVVHFAAVPRILIRPDNETFRVNTVGTYNVVEAAVKLGIRKIVVASSETTYGVCFADGRVNPRVLPLEEDYDVDPMDSYGLSKVVNEATARAFQRRSGSDIYCLRIGNVIEPHEYDRFPGFFADPEVRRRNVFCYIDARDLGQIVDLCLARDGLGFQIFNAGNDTNSVAIPSAELAARFFPGVPLTRDLGEHEALFCQPQDPRGPRLSRGARLAPLRAAVRPRNATSCRRRSRATRPGRSRRSARPGGARARRRGRRRRRSRAARGRWRSGRR